MRQLVAYLDWDPHGLVLVDVALVLEQLHHLERGRLSWYYLRKTILAHPAKSISDLILNARFHLLFKARLVLYHFSLSTSLHLVYPPGQLLVLLLVIHELVEELLVSAA